MGHDCIGHSGHNYLIRLGSNALTSLTPALFAGLPLLREVDVARNAFVPTIPFAQCHSLDECRTAIVRLTVSTDPPSVLPTSAPSASPSVPPTPRPTRYPSRYPTRPPTTVYQYVSGREGQKLSAAPAHRLPAVGAVCAALCMVRFGWT